MCLTLGFNTLRGLGSWGEAAVVWASCQNIPPSIWAIIRGKVGHQMGGNYQVERRGFARRGRRVQRQFVAVDNDRVARGATRAQLTVRRPRRPLQRTLTLVWREEIIGWTKGGAALERLLSWSPSRPVHAAPKTWRNFYSVAGNVLNSYKPPVKKCVSVSCVSVVERWKVSSEACWWMEDSFHVWTTVCLFVSRLVYQHDYTKNYWTVSEQRLGKE